ncbi:MAG: metal ABC transporter permease [Rickettsiaceae bacterium]|nr:metal ABC transporter permease [Rickettsiaceae bacterium]
MIIIILFSILVSLIFAPLGCFVLWKRYVYFGDGLAHASMLVAAISGVIGMPIIFSGMIVALIFALSVFKLRHRSGNNAAIGLISSFMISLALLLSYIYPSKINIGALLFGDMILANSFDLAVMCGLLLVVIVFFSMTYRQMLFTILSRDMASSRRINVNLLELAFLIILSLTVFLSIKIVGALLITSIILIPAMIARLISSSPSMMIGFAIFFSLLMNFCGICLSFYIDVPLAPMIILSGGGVYIITLFLRRVW